MCRFDLIPCDSPDAALHLQGIMDGICETLTEMEAAEDDVDEEHYGDELVPDGRAVL